MKGSITSEAVSIGHPDKVADRISDAVLDSCLKQDGESRVACETLVTTDSVTIAGEVTTSSTVDYAAVARDVIRRTGYQYRGFDWRTVDIRVLLHTQSPDIAQGVDTTSTHEQGAGDQGMMFGYAEGDSSTCFMPPAIYYAHSIMEESVALRGTDPFARSYLMPDAKCQLTFNENGIIDTVLLSHQHTEDADQQELSKYWQSRIFEGILPVEMFNENTRFLFNPTGRFVYGGPSADTGLTGRKIIADTYGGFAHHGGGAFSGKDPSKVDRSAAYMCRLAAKSLVANGLCKKCEVQVAYAIGVAQPVSLCVETFGTGDEQKCQRSLLDRFDFRPAAIIERLGLKQPSGWSYEQTAENGHFGHDGFPWEEVVEL